MGERWIKVASLAELPAGSMRAVDVEGTPVCLYNLGGIVCATQDTCTHAEASLAEGFIEGDMVECPLHQALFDIHTGKVMAPPAVIDLKVFKVEVEDDFIKVLADD